MPLPLGIGALNRSVLNKATRPILRWLPGFGVVHHRGRRSGRPFQTPVNLFPVEGGFVVALTYGTGTDWLKNVLAAGGCDIETRGRRVRCEAPEVFHDPTRHVIRPLEREILGVLRVDDFLRLRRVDGPTDGE